MRYLLPLLLIAGCTTIGTFHNPACVIFCKNDGGDSITTTKENQNEVALRRPSHPIQ